LHSSIWFWFDSEALWAVETPRVRLKELDRDRRVEVKEGRELTVVKPMTD